MTFEDGGLVTDLSSKLKNGLIKSENVAPAFAIKMEDRILTSIDNRRPFATNTSNTQLHIIEKNINEVMPDSFKYFIKPDGTKSPRFGNSNTFGEAVKFRIKNQKPADWRTKNPNGSFDLPILK